MRVDIIKTELDEIRDLRTMFLHENNFQFVCNKCHDYGWADTWLFRIDNVRVGYGSVWGTDRRQDRDTIFEFYLLPGYQKFASTIFEEMQRACKAIWIESQSNDVLLTTMLYRFCKTSFAEAILFEDHFQTSFEIPGAIFRKRSEYDPMDGDDSEYVLDVGGEIVASGGLMLNYNIPYADIYMQTKEPHREKGYATYIVQELKRTAYIMGRVPAARCNIGNRISQATLEKAGLTVCGFRLKGAITAFE
ncbi:N-acetyltransferase [Dyadobacter sp. CY261]|uniref:N-acetyltransferase n=1 Tax=Dyadobacter sp. CY261 TaxID=2907203 RepID=UPI001F3F88F8|nr:N-acetyltransferase [Dyadobacter sp. CY261]MCF0070127.1 N-acetyltransferase [Dyadobacter sp. CY261]